MYILFSDRLEKLMEEEFQQKLLEWKQKEQQNALQKTKKLLKKQEIEKKQNVSSMYYI